MKKGEHYRNDYTGEVVVIKGIESVRVGPGETYKDVVVLGDGQRWRAGDMVYPSPGFNSCHTRVKFQ